LLYCFLVVVAVLIYAQVELIAFVVAFYTVTFGSLVIYKSDLLDSWPPSSGPPTEGHGPTARQ